MHDPRLGRFFAVDPLASKYPYNSPYAFSENDVIASVELEGLERFYAADGTLLGNLGDSDEIYVTDQETWNGSAEFEDDSHRFSYLQAAGAKKFENSGYKAKNAILESIYTNDLGYKKPTNLDFMTEYNTGSPAKFIYYKSSGEDKMVISVDESYDFINSYDFLKNALVKEGTYANYYLKHGETMPGSDRHVELEGYKAALEAPSFKNAPKEYQKIFLQGAGGFIWEYKNMIDAYPESADNSKYWFNYYETFFGNHGAQFDFSKAEKKLEINQDFHQRKKGVFALPDNHEIGVTYDGEKL